MAEPVSGTLFYDDLVAAVVDDPRYLPRTWPEAFAQDRLEIVIRQRVGDVEGAADVIGARIRQLRVSPFARTAIQVEQEVGHSQGNVVGLEVGEVTGDVRLIAPEAMENLALLIPSPCWPS